MPESRDAGFSTRNPFAAAYITRSVSSLRRGRKDGTGPKFVRIGRSIRYLKSELDKYIDARVTIIGPEKLAELVLDAGLVNWLIRKVS